MIRHAPPLLILILLGITGCGDVAATPPVPSARPAKDQPSAEKAEKAEKEKMPEKVIRTEKEWRKLLTREQYRVLRMKGTEPPFRNRFDKHFEEGTYSCAACDQELFDSETKFDSGCGWPAFYAAKAGDRVKLTPDYSFGMIRTEVTCARCDSHLGHIFADAPQTPTGQRFCINSVSLTFKLKAAEEGAREKSNSATDEKKEDGKEDPSAEATEKSSSATETDE